MTCSPDLIHAYLDEELDATESAATERHMNTCPECAAAYVRLREQKAGVKASAPYYSAPPDLRAAVLEQLRASASPAAPQPGERSWRWLALAACLLLAVSLSSNLVQYRARQTGGNLEEALVAGHVRSLIGTHLVDVESSDQHTVKPWFNGKIDFAPQVRDLQAEGFPLVGGRVDYMAGRRVAALVYRRRQHTINVFVWPAESNSTAPARLARDGYTLLHWTSGPMTYWAVSDVSPVDLEELRNLLATGARP